MVSSQTKERVSALASRLNQYRGEVTVHFEEPFTAPVGPYDGEGYETATTTATESTTLHGGVCYAHYHYPSETFVLDVRPDRDELGRHGLTDEGFHLTNLFTGGGQLQVRIGRPPLSPGVYPREVAAEYDGNEDGDVDAETWDDVLPPWDGQPTAYTFVRRDERQENKRRAVNARLSDDYVYYGTVSHEMGAVKTVELREETARGPEGQL